MRITIAGSRGMLGSDLVQVCGASHDVSGFDIDTADIADPEQCVACLRTLKPDVVICSAALTDVDYCESHPEEAAAVNGHGAANLAAAAASAGIFFVHYSTDYVFDGTKSGPYVEEDTPNPLSVYGHSKLLGEDLIRECCAEHLILRTSWLYGRHGRNFIRTILSAAMKEPDLRVVNDQRGSPTYSRDLAAQTLRMIERGCRGTYHVTNSGDCTWYELALRSVEWAGLGNTRIAPVFSHEFPRPARRPANSVLANARLARENIPLMRSWQEAAREYVEQGMTP